VKKELLTDVDNVTNSNFMVINTLSTMCIKSSYQMLILWINNLKS